MEFDILRRQTPSLTRVLIGSGASPVTFRGYLRDTEISAVVLVDEKRELMQSLQSLEPIALVIDSLGRIVLVDDRTTSAAAQFPIGAVLYELTSVLRVAH